ncbi:hypothetical protein [Acinetobacter gerneri]|jgi:hypothetical protein|uniref:hypothetical protein n=1 Tax=Acinetobacter gerneri TaxID=202952 RepID=UPI0023F0525E|nr:hypothetical protein [Acinetobacter gerneri]MCH4243740.1 hypothetical protein [Acinetobacter gerneri]
MSNFKDFSTKANNDSLNAQANEKTVEQVPPKSPQNPTPNEATPNPKTDNQGKDAKSDQSVSPTK